MKECATVDFIIKKGNTSMIQIDYLEMLKAIRKCVQNPRYRVGIFMSTMRENTGVYMDAVRAISIDDEERNAMDSSPQRKDRIAFNNGSAIQFVRASENARGHRFNAILYGPNIEHEILHCVIQPTERKYMRMGS